MFRLFQETKGVTPIPTNDSALKVLRFGIKGGGFQSILFEALSYMPNQDFLQSFCSWALKYVKTRGDNDKIQALQGT